MKNVLIVIAHPKKDSLSFAIADKYKEVCVKKGDKIEIIDLYQDKHQQPFFTYENANNLQTTKEMAYFQNKISKADELVFVFPYWWGGVPAILKNFFDWNFSSGYAFKYIKGRPVGLLSGKNVKIFTTTGAPSFIYFISGAKKRLKDTLKKQIISFCAMKLVDFNMYGSVYPYSKKIPKILQSIK